MSRGPVLTVSVISDPEALSDLRPEWRRLHAASGSDLFVSSEWLIPWWQHLAEDRELFVMLARDDDGRLRGLLALSLQAARVGFRNIRRLRFLGDDHVSSDYLDAIIEPGWNRAANRAFGGALVARRSEWDLLELRDMDQQSSTPHELLDALGDGFDMRSDPGLLCPVQDFDHDLALTDFMSQTSRFKNYTRRRKWLERQPGFHIEVCRDADGLQPALDHFFRLHRLRWREEGGSSGIAGTRVEAFHREAMIRLMATDQLRLYTLWVDELAVASVYGLVHGGTFYYYQAGMDPEWRSRSVGLVLIGETFIDALRSGLTRYDFLRGEEPYKFDWVGGSRRLVSRRLFAHRGAGAIAVHGDIRLAQGRTLAKKWIRRAFATLPVIGAAGLPGSIREPGRQPDCLVSSTTERGHRQSRLSNEGLKQSSKGIAMDIQQATDDDREAIVDLFKRYDFALQSMDWFEWKYHSNPVGDADRFKILSEGRIVGAVAILPQRFTWLDREITGLQAVDGLLGKEVRGRGNFSQVMQFLAAQRPAGVSDESFYLSFPSLPASIRAHESSGWDRLASFSLSICMLTPRLPLEKAGAAAMRRVLEFPWAAYRKWIMGPKAGTVQVRYWNGDDGPFNSFSPVDRICGDRSFPFMNWRVKKNPRDDIQLLMIYERDTLEGYAVTKISGCTTKVLELRIRRPRRRHIRALIRYIYEHHRSDAVAFWSLGRFRIDELIRGMGFVRRHLSGDCFVHHLQRAGLPADPEKWDLTYLDSDW